VDPVTLKGVRNLRSQTRYVDGHVKDLSKRLDTVNKRIDSVDIAEKDVRSLQKRIKRHKVVSFKSRDELDKILGPIDARLKEIKVEAKPEKKIELKESDKEKSLKKRLRELNKRLRKF